MYNQNFDMWYLYRAVCNRITMCPPPLDFQTLRRPCHMIVEHNHYGLRKDFDEDTAIHALSADAARMAIARTPIK